MLAIRAHLQRQLHNGALYAVLAALGFSFKAIFVKLAYAAGPVDAISLLAMRMGIALPLFVWLVWFSRGSSSAALGLGDGLRVALLGLFGYYLASLFDFYGLQYISAGLERLILFAYPTLVLVFQAVALRERPSLRTLSAMGLCYLGLGIAFVHDLGMSGGGQQVLVGALWVFASAVTYALYYAGTGMMLKRMGSMRLAGLCGTASSLMVLAHYLLVADTAQLWQLPPAVWTHAAMMAVFSTVLPIYWVALAIQRMGVTQTAAVGNLGPMLTVLASWAILGESISAYQIAGLALVLFGVSRLKPAKR
ncbi:DMT family transporter [Pseudomonas guariconensis]|uniref:DMT family transporter n=1 Tax=Pseudomonas TaxID=286 RepID=UPI0020981838|nr:MULTISPECIES: DMT family transporter [Pseudomonas]MCO7640058.1 DMT family transporter [Pseudomonas sp. S 311-6]MCO7514517.1 DMT family transporter [Pseudomonas putida]MCO7565481.1 DMT family transporter [Pseudomonas mosselii]MCO7604570.1 DMT family transporter [Pseudomonas guariconensis]MCO7616635.1 DMT family transporter [Pseudomonas guariconensis]